MIDPKVALMTAPIPMDDWAEMDATAMPMKYESGMTDAMERAKMKTRDDRKLNKGPRSRCSESGRRTQASKMTKKTSGRRLMKRMLTPPTVYLKYCVPAAR